MLIAMSDDEMLDVTDWARRRDLSAVDRRVLSAQSPGAIAASSRRHLACADHGSSMPFEKMTRVTEVASSERRPIPIVDGIHDGRGDTWKSRSHSALSPGGGDGGGGNGGGAMAVAVAMALAVMRWRRWQAAGW